MSWLIQQEELLRKLLGLPASPPRLLLRMLKCATSACQLAFAQQVPPGGLVGLPGHPPERSYCNKQWSTVLSSGVRQLPSVLTAYPSCVFVREVYSNPQITASILSHYYYQTRFGVILERDSGSPPCSDRNNALECFYLVAAILHASCPVETQNVAAKQLAALWKHLRLGSAWSNQLAAPQADVAPAPLLEETRNSCPSCKCKQGLWRLPPVLAGCRAGGRRLWTDVGAPSSTALPAPWHTGGTEVWEPAGGEQRAVAKTQNLGEIEARGKHLLSLEALQLWASELCEPATIHV